MCLVTEQKEPIILQEDLEVVKILSEDRRSIFFGTIYEENKLYQTEIEDIVFDKNAQISFYDEKAGNEYDYISFQDALDVGLKIIGPGFHFALERDRLSTEWHEEVFTATIPKGSEVYFDKSGLGVANQIIVH